jgi:hypothetical protein
MKHLTTGLHAFTITLGTSAVALADEATKEGGGGYAATAYVWFGLIFLILAYGIYDTFWGPVD